MADEDTSLIEVNATVLEDIKEDSIIEDAGTSPVVNYIYDKYKLAKDYRKTDEQRWLKAYTNYRGVYGQDVQFTEAEKSRVFIKVTKTKTVAAYGQLIDVLFGTGQFPIAVKETRLPEGIAKDAHIELNQPNVGIEGPEEGTIDV